MNCKDIINFILNTPIRVETWIPVKKGTNPAILIYYSKNKYPEIIFYPESIINILKWEYDPICIAEISTFNNVQSRYKLDKVLYEL